MSTLSQTPAPPSKVGELLSALRQLAAADGSPETFYSGWLQQTTLAAEAIAGRLRRPASDGALAVTAVAGSPEALGREPDSPSRAAAESVAAASSGTESADTARPPRYFEMLLETLS